MTLVKIFVLLVIIIEQSTEAARTTRFPIGGLFNTKSLPSSRQAFEKLVKIGTTKAYYGRAINLKVVDSYSTAVELCPHTSENKGVVALIDARATGGECDTTCLLCNKLNISHLSLGWEPPATIAQDAFTLLYHPPPELISKAYATLIKTLQWDKFSFLYEDDGSFVRQQEIINSWPYKNERVVFRRLYPGQDNKETFKYILKVVHMSRHVLDCDVGNIRQYMKDIVEVDNSTQYQSFILTALDAYTVTLDGELMANVSTLHLTTRNEDRWKDLDMDADDTRLETALTADALNHLEKAIRGLIEQGKSGQNEADEDEGYVPRSEPLQLSAKDLPGICFQKTKADYELAAWPLGDLLREALLKTTTKGFTGHIEFDKNGKRTNFELHYSKLSNESKFIHVGYWDSKKDMFKNERAVSDRSSPSNRKSVIRVVSLKGLPYFDITTINGSTQYRGYAVDLIDAIFTHIREEQHKDLRYEFYRVNKYGNPIYGTKKWDGIIGELMEHNAELAICDLTITAERNAVVDFSIPFMSLGISILMKEPSPLPPDMFSFIQPLSLDVWLYLATTYIIVSFVILICARMSQADWVNPHPCNQNPENLQNIWSLYNCMWLTMGAIMTQGCDILPRAAGSRWVTGMWWFFALIITASYTANMSNFLSNDRRSNEISDIKELSEQTKVSYGVVYNGSTYKFFEQSNDSVYQKIWNVMNTAKPPAFMNDNIEGTNRVLRSKQGNYAFLMESTAIEYYKQRNCSLKMVGPTLDSKDYGIAMPKNSPHKTLVDNAIIALQESGWLLELKTKWWEKEDNKENCKKSESEEDDNGLQMKNTSGIFLVLIVGGILGLIVAVIDFLLHARQICVKEKVTFSEALASEWRASFNPRALHKPAAPPRSAPPSTASPSPPRERSRSRAVSVLRAASSFINFDEIY